MTYGKFPNTLKVIDPTTGTKLDLPVKNWDNVKAIQEMGYEILEWKED